MAWSLELLAARGRLLQAVALLETSSAVMLAGKA